MIKDEKTKVGKRKNSFNIKEKLSYVLVKLSVSGKQVFCFFLKQGFSV